MIPRKLMQTRPAILLLCFLTHYSATVAASDYVIITGGIFAANQPVSVVAANPTATTLAATTTLTITFEGSSTVGTQVGTITETFVVGPSTGAYTERLSGLSQTNACVLTRSVSQGSCSFASTALNTDSGSVWYTAFNTYTLASADFNLQLSYTVTAGQEKLLPTITTSSAPSTSSVPLTSSAPSTGSVPSASSALSTSPAPSASSALSASSTSSASSAPSTSSVLAISSAPSASSAPSTSSTQSTISVPLSNSAPSASFVLSTSPPTSTIPPPISNPASNSTAASASNLATTAALTPIPTMPIVNGVAIRHNTRSLSSAVVGLATTIIVAIFLCF